MHRQARHCDSSFGVAATNSVASIAYSTWASGLFHSETFARYIATTPANQSITTRTRLDRFRRLA